jgi:hypothetical protein
MHSLPGELHRVLRIAGANGGNDQIPQGVYGTEWVAKLA